MALWRALGDLLDGKAAGRLRLAAPGRLELRLPKPLHESLRNRPVLHLDATLRPDLAGAVLPGLEVVAIEADAPGQRLTLVTGSFGKSTLCPAPQLSAEVAARRRKRLEDCVTFVRRQARRFSAGAVLVVTFQAIGQALAGIPGVHTAK